MSSLSRTLLKQASTRASIMALLGPPHKDMTAAQSVAILGETDTWWSWLEGGWLVVSSEYLRCGQGEIAPARWHGGTRRRVAYPELTTQGR